MRRSRVHTEIVVVSAADFSGVLTMGSETRAVSTQTKPW